MPDGFNGFPAEGFRFFRQLAANNNRDWFQAHKDVYERQCRAPMQLLMDELEPRYGKSKISRINRDLRFSRNRAPYKTYIAAGLGGNYIALSADGVWVGGGMYKPDAATLKRLRAAIDDSKTGSRLAQIVTTLRKKGYDVDSHDRLSSAPRGYEPDHPRLALLQMKDIYAGQQFSPQPWLSTAKARARIEQAMTDTRPLIKWLQQHVTRGQQKSVRRS